MSGAASGAADDPVAACREAYARGDQPERAVERAAVKQVLAVLAGVAPGSSVEIRIPPYAVIQAVPGPVHRRGTPAAVVETDAPTLLGLAAGRTLWSDAVVDGRVRASGERSDLSALFPLPEV